MSRTRSPESPLIPLPHGMGWQVHDRDMALQLLSDDRVGVMEPGPVMDALTETLNPKVRPAAQELTSFAERIMLQTGLERHAVLRRAFGRFFNATGVEALLPTLRSEAEHVLRPLVRDGGGEFMTGVAFPYAVRTGARLIGVTDHTYRSLHRLSQRVAIVAYAARLNDPEKAVREGHTSLAQVRELISAARATAPADSVLGIWNRGEIGDLSDEDIEANTVMLVQASLETVAGMLGNAAVLILGSADALSVPERREGLLDDALRASPPLKTLERVVRDPFQVNGHEFERGQVISVRVADANQVNDDSAAGRALFSFGWGAYRCLGARLARSQANELFAALHRLAPDAALTDTEVERVRHIRFDMPRRLRFTCSMPGADTVTLTQDLCATLEEKDVDRPLTSLEYEMAAVVVQERGFPEPPAHERLTTIREWVAWATSNHG